MSLNSLFLGGAIAPELAQDLQQLRKGGVLRHLDVKVAEFLCEQYPDASPEAALLAALISAQQAEGHLCLDLGEPDLYRRLFYVETQLTGQFTWLRPVLLPEDITQWRIWLAESSFCSGSDSPLVLEKNRVYLRRHWQQEAQVAGAIAERLRVQQPQVEGLKARLDALFPEPKGQEPNWQRAACAMAASRAFTIITGGPGTGKTTTVVKLLALLQQMAMEKKKVLRIRLAAPTGKAAARLTESISEQITQLPVPLEVQQQLPTEVATLHRLLGSRPNSRRFRHDSHHPIAADLVVVDEASMIDMELMAALLQALSPGTKLVLLGDKDQLASVEAGAIMGELCGETDAVQLHYHASVLQELTQAGVEGLEHLAPAPNASLLAQHIVMLRKSYRFDANSGIGELARAVNSNNRVQIRTLLEQGGVAASAQDLAHEKLTHETFAERLPTLLMTHNDGLRQLFRFVHNPMAEPDEWARVCLKQLSRQQLLSGLRNGPYGVEHLNRLVEAHLRHLRLVPASTPQRPNLWYAGRPVMVTRNDYQLNLMNGDVGITLELAGQLRVAFELPNGNVRWVSPRRLSSVETVYAMTVHKSQGSGFGHTLLVLPPSLNPVFTRELMYTAITRSEARFTLITTGGSVFEHAVERVTQRASGLWEKIQQATN